jgi:hypothetical protein
MESQIEMLTVCDKSMHERRHFCWIAVEWIDVACAKRSAK